MSVYYGLTGGGVGRVIAGKAGIYDLDTDFLLGAGISTAYVVTTINESTIVVAKTGTYRVWLGGARGSGGQRSVAASFTLNRGARPRCTIA